MSGTIHCGTNSGAENENRGERARVRLMAKTKGCGRERAVFVLIFKMGQKAYVKSQCPCLVTLVRYPVI